MVSLWGHSVARVQRVQKVHRVQRGRLTALRAEGCGRLSAAGCVRFAQGATAPAALRVVDCPSGNAYKVSVTGLAFYVIWHEKHSADWLATLSPLWWLRHHLSPASGDTTTRAKLRVTYEKIASRSFVLPPLAGEVPRSGQGGMHFLARQGGCKGFSRQRRHKKMAPKAPYLASGHGQPTNR